MSGIVNTPLLSYSLFPAEEKPLPHFSLCNFEIMDENNFDNSHSTNTDLARMR
jgi:hypothetical protein